MNILYSGDENIADGLIVSCLSLAKCVKEPLNIFILTAGFEHNGIKICYAGSCRRTGNGG